MSASMTSIAAAELPPWHPHPDVWIGLSLLGAAYAVAVIRLGPRHAPDPSHPTSRLQVVSFALGISAIWLAVDWPVHDVAEKSLYSVHMVQHLALMLVAAPLLLLGTPGWVLRWLLRPDCVLRVVRWLARFLPALILFNIVIVLAHWPAVVDVTLRNESAHLAAHVVLMISALVVWLPVVSPLPEIPRLAPPARMAFLFLWSIVPTVPASFLTFGDRPLYKFYESVDQLGGLTAAQDQQIAGLVMKIGAGLLLWVLIAVIFFRWYADEEASSRLVGSHPGQSRANRMR